MDEPVSGRKGIGAGGLTLLGKLLQRHIDAEQHALVQIAPDSLPQAVNARKIAVRLHIIRNVDDFFQQGHMRSAGRMIVDGGDDGIVLTENTCGSRRAGLGVEQLRLRVFERRYRQLPMIDQLLLLRRRERLGNIVQDPGTGSVRLIRAVFFCQQHGGIGHALRVGAALGVGKDCEYRASELLAAGADVLVMDSAHGHSVNILRAIEMIRGSFPSAQIIAGNVATYEGAKALIRAGVDTVKVGIGPGSICTTRVVAGVGVPQVTAVMESARAAREAARCIIADGGLKFSGDVVKALACGAHTVMLGSLLAGTDESPGETILYQGRTYKIYRGMGSIDAMKAGSSDRYFQEKSKKLVPEGIVGRVPSRGPVAETVYQLIGGLRSGMGYLGAASLEELFQKARMVEISAAGLRESHVHDVIITKEAPNYRVEN